MKSVITRSKYPRSLMFVCFLMLNFQSFGQTQNEIRILQPDQTIEVEVTGKITHRYKVDLKANEFFQVRVEQKGVDVSLNLTDEKSNILATMDSPNGKEGFETLSFAANEPGVFILEVNNSSEETENVKYLIRREGSRVATEKDKRHIEAEKDFAEAIKVLNSDKKTALEKLKKSNKIFNETGNVELKKMSLQFSDFLEMSVTFDEARRFNDNARFFFTEGRDKGNLQILKSAKDEILKADKAFHTAEELAKNLLVDHPDFVLKNPTLKNFPVTAKTDQMNVAVFLSNYYKYFLESALQLEYAEKAVAISKEAESLETFNFPKENKLLDSTATLLHLASALSANKNPQAITYYEQTLEKYRQLKKLGSQYYQEKQEASFLQNIAFTYSELCKEKVDYCKQKVIENYAEAIKIHEQLKDYKTVAELLSSIATIYYTEEPFKSFEYLERALLLAQQIDNKELISQILFYKGSLFLYLGNEAKSKENFRKGLEVALSVPSYTTNIDSAAMPPLEKRNRLHMEYARLLGITAYYSGLSEYSKATDVAKESFRVAKLLEEKPNVADSFRNIASTYRDLKDWQNAIDYYKQSLTVNNEIGDPQRKALNLLDIGLAQLELKKPNEALQSLTESQIVFSSLGVDDSGVTNGLAKTWYALGNRQLAIFYGKKFVGWIQNERQKLGDFDQTTQQTFISSFEKPIRRLADWLIEEKQFAEAKQVLRLLKEKEFSDFLRRDADGIKNSKTRIDSSDEEKQAIAKYSQLTKEIGKSGQEFYRLEQKQIRLREKGLDLNEADTKLFKDAAEKLENARLVFKTFLDKELVKEFVVEKEKNIESQNKKRADSQKMPEGAATLYTLLGEDRYRVILTTPTVEIAGKYEIKADKLNQKILAFRNALQNPEIDPRPLGKELYDILIKPIEKDLQNSGAKTLLWYLDGTLRFIPISALSPDGKSYLVEEYQSVILTANSENLETQKNDVQWKVLGMGVSDAQKVDNPLVPNEKIEFDALPGTKRELTEIISDETTREKSGILSGRRFLNETFTMKNFENSLGAGKFNVIHLASHFYLGNKNSNSFLLLGNGQILSLEKIKFGDFISFGGAEIVTLSACNTAFANSSNGAEVDSLADVIQSQGGKSVLATLWAVADDSTSLLMSEFYRIKKNKPNLTKAEAIQAVQIAMISGKLTGTNSETTKGIKLANQDQKKSDLPAFEIDKNKPFAHPYFWSPFVLIGNWK